MLVLKGLIGLHRTVQLKLLHHNCLGNRYIQRKGRRKWHPTPVPLPGKFHGWRSLVGYNPWGCKESDMTEQLHFHIERKDHMQAQGEASHLQAIERGSLKKPTLPTPESWISSLQKCMKINYCCLSSPVCGMSLLCP